jgi:hypothetical protein
MADTKSLSVDLLRLDANTQNRLKINEEAVEDYAELIGGSDRWPLGPLDVFHDGNEYYVADGFHRTLAAVKAKRSSVPCNVHNGTAKDARIFGMTANDRHGLRMSRADKRSCVEWLLDNEKLNQAEIAEKSGVSLRSVKYIVADRKPSVLDKKVQIAPNFRGGKGKDERTDSTGTKPQETSHRPPRSGKAKPVASKDYGKCPNCQGSKWTEDEFGVSCAKCNQPHGEPVGDADEQRVNDQHSKAVKTCQALRRELDELKDMHPNPAAYKESTECNSRIWHLLKGWRK